MHVVVASVPVIGWFVGINNTFNIRNQVGKRLVQRQVFKESTIGDTVLTATVKSKLIN